MTTFRHKTMTSRFELGPDMTANNPLAKVLADELDGYHSEILLLATQLEGGLSKTRQKLIAARLKRLVSVSVERTCQSLMQAADAEAEPTAP